jgi:ribosomal protein S18 acetylase RimI-like enzyme
VSELLLRYCFKYGEIFASSEKFEGIMAYTSGKLSYMKMWRLIRSNAIFPFMKLGGNVGRRISLAFAPMETDRKKHMRQNSFIYLFIIGVSTKSQGKGHGAKLLKSLNEMSDQAELPIYLETETENNVRLYEKFGFKILDQRMLPVVNLPVWEMKRDPTN